MNTLTKLSLYNDWANNLLLDHFNQLNDNVPATSLRLLSHVVNTQLAWLSRIINEPAVVLPWDEHALATCREMHRQTSARLKTCVSSLGDQEKIIAYTNFKGVRYENTEEDILLHVFNHGTYHRAQIAQDMRRSGLEPLNTDYITYVREGKKNS
jgi:uncharacterized damage-inducible protein DinB